MRRFTTDSGRVPTIASLSTQRSGQDSQDYGPSVSYCPSTTIAVVLATTFNFPIVFEFMSNLYNSGIAFANFQCHRRITRFNL